MELFSVDTEKCARDGMCVESCPAALLELGPDGLPRGVPGAADACYKCGHCVAICPTGALGNALTPSETYAKAQTRSQAPAPEAVEGLMLARRSVREFKDAPVPRETLERLIETARHAPTAVNSQNISWIVVQDRERIKRIARLCAEWMRPVQFFARYVSLWDGGKDVVTRGAPCLVMATTPAEYNWADTDGAIALSYMELDAASHGLGACWAGLVTRAALSVPEVAAELGIPEGQRPCGGLMVGLPKYRYRLVPPRNPASVIWR